MPSVISDRISKYKLEILIQVRQTNTIHQILGNTNLNRKNNYDLQFSIMPAIKYQMVSENEIGSGNRRQKERQCK